MTARKKWWEPRKKMGRPRKPKPPQMKRPMGRPMEIYKRANCPSKVALLALGGITRAIKLFASIGITYSPTALYTWLRKGYIPDKALPLLLRLCQEKGIALPPGFERWSETWLTENATAEPVAPGTPVSSSTPTTAEPPAPVRQLRAPL